MENLLILESDDKFADTLVEALAELQSFATAVVPSVKDACLKLMEQSQALAFIPAEQGEKIVRSLRAVQPDLRLVLVAPDPDYQLPDSFAGQVQGVLFKSHLDADLFSVLEQALLAPLVPGAGDPAAETGLLGELPAMDTAVLIAALQQAQLGRLVQAVVFARRSQLLAHWGELNATQAATVALRVGEGMPNEPPPARLQFMHLPARAGDLLLYTRRVNTDYLLTMAAIPETPVGELRAQAEPLVVSLTEALHGRKVFDAAVVNGSENGRDARKPYAIVWRPVRPLPVSLHIPLRRAIERLAVANACVITHINVQSELVHLVVICPPGRDSVWAAYLFKNGSERTIQQEFNVRAELWDTGFYATESTEPLSEAELNIFLEPNQTG
ncbi:MAG: hypothetical protein ACE5FD_03335 [Anaerolineae bacterium]